LCDRALSRNLALFAALEDLANNPKLGQRRADLGKTSKPLLFGHTSFSIIQQSMESILLA
jgi:hypothetical protein